MAQTTTFTMRISQKDHDLLTGLAAILNMTTAELARTIMSEGIRERLDPDAIDRRIEAERQRQKQAADEIRKRAAAHAAADSGQDCGND
ncbi:hypothetical protein DFR70_13311 [Nocardia tenerifensis]|uniref:Uncharacterized protein n=1 Tax=Nocardia tenerifensis TaxID=228006 RepID=A0A318JRE2_9NOCA|nr:hypothetical protein [Nocardia tenerifensis]PXX52279.1 hypothetical protein DFR70_13311 [Nocardia tenerifensis]